MSSEADPTTKRRELAEQIRQRVDTGEVYFKSSSLAEDLGMSAKEVGTNLSFLSDEVDDLHIEKWARASTATTWRIELVDD